MNRLIKPVVIVGLSALVAILVAVPLAAQEHEEHSEGAAEHKLHRNHFGGIIGVSTHHDVDDSALTLGLEYARVFTPRWALAAYIELVSSDLERDVILAIGAIYYPFRRLGIVVAPGVEQASREVEHDGETKTEDELALMIRFGLAYAFSLTPEAALAPAVFFDYSGKRWTSLLGVSMVVGFGEF